uniref:Retrotransposon protein, putative, Ty1-copia subclass n=1 Tax=Tanacetum cinerariifolium TaxID=118510 RepID=A0A6L2JFI8_TANCI|nr:retrotransposon protein, putative, Ty1-copia subclass [Tanacetum cinerariifolium]
MFSRAESQYNGGCYGYGQGYKTYGYAHVDQDLARYYGGYEAGHGVYPQAQQQPQTQQKIIESDTFHVQSLRSSVGLNPSLITRANIDVADGVWQTSTMMALICYNIKAVSIFTHRVAISSNDLIGVACEYLPEKKWALEHKEDEDFIGCSEIVQPEATGRMSLSVIMKCTMAIRQLAYGTTPDVFDEYLQISANNNINILDNSLLFDDLLDDKALVAPYVANGVRFEKGYYLAEEENPFGRRPPPQARPQNRNNVLRSLGVRVEIPDFAGAAQPNEFIDWLSTVERVFDLRDIPDHFKLKVVAIKLRNLSQILTGYKCVVERMKKKNSGYHQIQLRPGDEWKMPFKTPDGLYEWMMDDTKVHAITSWPTPKTLHDIRSFHGLASFYRRFIRNFSTIVAPITECLKGSIFAWDDAAQKAFDELKLRVTSASVLALPNFNEVFQVEYDASVLGIDGILSQGQSAIAFLAKNSMTQGESILQRGFDMFQHLYHDGPDFATAWKNCLTRPFHEFTKHEGGLGGHFGRDKTVGLIRDRFYRPNVVKDVSRILERCRWDLVLSQAEFAYNRSNHGSTGKSPFFVVYGHNPFTPLDLTPCPRADHFNPEGETWAKQIQELHMQVRERIIKHNMQYQHRANQHRKRMVFDEGDLVWIHLRKERFSGGHFGNLRPRADGPFKVLKRINDNAYKIELPRHYNVSATFNVGNLTPYVPTDNDVVTDSRSSPFYVREDDADTDHEPNDMGLPHIDSLDNFGYSLHFIVCFVLYNSTYVSFISHQTCTISPTPPTVDFYLNKFALTFAYHYHDWLGRITHHPSLRETIIGHSSSLLAYSPDWARPNGPNPIKALSKAREDDEWHQESRQDWPDQIMLQQSSPYKADGTLSLYKARLVANGSTKLKGVDVDETIILKKYAFEILERADMVHCNPSRTPIDTESKLGTTGDMVSDPTLYRSLAGSLQYLTFARSDISCTVQQLFPSSTTDLVAYSNADWAGCPTTRRSTLAHSFINDLLLPNADVPTRRVNVVSTRINIFGWRVGLGRLPTRLNHSFRGIDIPSILCPLCSIAVESSSHLLFSCQLARTLMLKVGRWLELDIHDFNSYGDWIVWLNNIRFPSKLKEILEVYDAHNEVACLMLGSMTPELHRQFENYSPYEMLLELRSMFEKQARVERFDLIQTFHACKQEDGKPVGQYVLKMKGYVDQLERFGYVLLQDLSVGLILNGLTSDFASFVRNYNMHNMGKTIGELHALLRLQHQHPTKNDTCHQYKEVGHWKKNCLVYLAELMKNKKQVGTDISSDCNGIYKIDMSNLVSNVNSIYNVSNKRVKHNLDSTYLWHCRLAHISKKRIENLQQDGLLKSTDKESFDQCESCLSGKMTRKSSPHHPKRATDLLGLIHTDVYGLLRHVSRQGASYFITFTDDYSRYGYIYLLKHNHEVFETFKVFKNEVENQLEKNIKALRSDRGDMVRSMMNLLTLPLSFLDYALESAARILNMVPTKKADKTPYDRWYGKVPNLYYLKVWGCEALVKQDTPDKLQQRFVKCILLGYPKETMGYYFYFPPENKIVVVRYAEFVEKNIIFQEVSRRAVEYEEIQDVDTSPFKITSEISIEVEGFEPPKKEVILIRRSERTHQVDWKSSKKSTTAMSAIEAEYIAASKAAMEAV